MITMKMSSRNDDDNANNTNDDEFNISFSFHLFAFINYSTKLKLIIIHLAGSPGSYFAYLKDCLKKRSKKLECKLSVAEQKY